MEVKTSYEIHNDYDYELLDGDEEFVRVSSIIDRIDTLEKIGVSKDLIYSIIRNELSQSRDGYASVSPTQAHNPSQDKGLVKDTSETYISNTASLEPSKPSFYDDLLSWHELYSNDVSCPFCASKDVKVNGEGFYRCKSCDNSFVLLRCTENDSKPSLSQLKEMEKDLAQEEISKLRELGRTFGEPVSKPSNIPIDQDSLIKMWDNPVDDAVWNDDDAVWNEPVFKPSNIPKVRCKIHDELTDDCDDCWNSVYAGTDMEIKSEPVSKTPKRVCHYCGKPMGNSWHTEMHNGKKVYVHVKHLRKDVEV